MKITTIHHGNKTLFKAYNSNDQEDYRLRTFATKEPETVEFINRLPDNAVLYDIGANIGLFSLYCAAIHPQSTVVAFEPVPYNFLRLQENIALNGFHNIIPLPFCVGDSNGPCTLAVGSDVIGATGAQMDMEKGKVFSSYKVRLTHAALIMGFPMPSHLKIDIDGQEESVIKGAWGLFRSAIKGLIVESNTDLSGILTEYGFKEDPTYPHPEGFWYEEKWLKKTRNGIWGRA